MAATTEPACVAELIGVRKSFGGHLALKDASLSLRPGEIHALVGENGAGKSTMMKVLSGAYRCDAGTILIEGKPASIQSPADGRMHGIAIIYQEFALAPHLTVAENMFLGRLKRGGPLIRWSRLYRQAEEQLERLGFRIDPRAIAGNLSVAYQQVVEIAKALTETPKVLVLDEPTAVLTPDEAERLFGVLEDLRRQGVSVVYISHRLEEIYRLADRITVFKDGANVGTVLPSETPRDELIRMMIGRNLETFFPKRSVAPGAELLRADRVTAGSKVKEASFSLRSGEVLGIAGLMGSGRTELARALFGIDPIEGGEVRLRNRPLRIRSPRDAVEAGIALVPESRKEHGVLLSMSVAGNMSLPNAKAVVGPIGTLSRKKETALAEALVRKLHIKTATVHHPVGAMSGGNQQKVAIAKWHAAEADVYIFDEPTRGVDVGAKVEIYRLMNELAAGGAGVLMISSDVMELIGMCDRIMVVRDGSIQATLEGSDITEEHIMRYAIGG